MYRLLVALGGPLTLAAGLTLGGASPSTASPAPGWSAGVYDEAPTSAAGPFAAATVGRVSGQGGPGFSAIRFVDPARGWLAGQGFILATTDGGQTWAPQLPTTDPIASFDFVDARTGWAVGARALLGTADGGQRWERRGDTDAPLIAVSFATSEVGWGLPAPPRGGGPGGAPAGGGAPGGGPTAPPGGARTSDGAPAPAGGAGAGAGAPAARLLGSHDGGQTWEAAAAPGPLQAICRADAASGWAVGNGRVWRQAGGDDAWTLTLTAPGAPAADAPAGPGAGYGGEVQCPDADTAWVLFTAPGGMMQIGWALYRTGDGGATWTPVAQSGQFFPETGAPRGAGGWNRVRLAVVDSTTAYVVGTCVPCSPPGAEAAGTISLGVSRDAGQSWQDLPPLPDAFGAAIVSAPFAASFPTATQGWLIAPGSASVYATTDGGSTWTARALAVTP